MYGVLNMYGTLKPVAESGLNGPTPGSFPMVFGQQVFGLQALGLREFGQQELGQQKFWSTRIWSGGVWSAVLQNQVLRFPFLCRSLYRGYADCRFPNSVHITKCAVERTKHLCLKSE